MDEEREQKSVDGNKMEDKMEELCRLLREMRNTREVARAYTQTHTRNTHTHTHTHTHTLTLSLARARSLSVSV